MRLTRHQVSLFASIAALLIYALSHSLLVSDSLVRSPVNFTPNTSLELIVEPRDGVAPLLSRINEASSSVDLVMYQLSDTQVEQALIAAHDRGVAVRVLLNGGYYGKKESSVNDDAYRILSDARVPIEWTPTYVALTHQKTLVVDGKTALIMTFNLVPKYYATGRDFGIVDTDERDVTAIEHAFNSDWNASKQTPEQGNDLVWSPGAKTQTLTLIQDAAHTLDVYNEEMADTAVTHSLVAAAQRGVVVRIVMTDNKNWHAAFDTLRKAGVHIRVFAPKDPLYIHAKMILADDSEAFVGSQNFSENSLTKNRELGIILSASSSITTLKETFEKDWGTAQVY